MNIERQEKNAGQSVRQNLALIDEEEVTFTEGLNVLSGETGAGKSILIGSVLIALGAKVHKEMIRANEKEAYIELIFSPTHPGQFLKSFENMILNQKMAS